MIHRVNSHRRVSASVRILVLVLPLALLMSGVSGCRLLEPAPPARVVEPQVEWPAPIASQAQHGTLRVMRPEADLTRDARQILVRRDDASLQRIPRYLWLEKSPDLLRSLVLDSVRRAGPFDDAAASGPADWVLSTTLRRFEGVDSDGRYGVQIQLFARLIDQPSGSTVASRLFEIEQPSRDNTPASFIAAFEQALSSLMLDLSNWLAEHSTLTDQ